MYDGLFHKNLIKRRGTMIIDIRITEAIELFKEIQKQPKKLFEIVRADAKETQSLKRPL